MAMDLFPSNHPLTPPHSEEERLAWLRLLRSRRVGVATFFRMMTEYGSAQAALAALPDVARAAGVAQYTACPEPVALAELRAGKLAGARLVAYGSPEYPAALANIPDPPPLLWVSGDAALLARPMVALVGARNASSLGVRMARKLAFELAEVGYIVVSGLARGIDTAAHQAALGRGTLAVMAGGVDVIYPTENTALAQDIFAKGALISEQPMGLQPQARHFPMRNRIVSGLSRAVIVVEAASGSGSLITARYALEQGRDVLSVPGHPFDARASGCNALIRDGAPLIRTTRDVFEVIGQPEASAPPPAAAPVAPAKPRSLAEISALHSQILGRLGPSPIAEDQLIRDLGTEAQTIAPALLSLEIDGKVLRQPGGLLSLAEAPARWRLQ